MTVYVCVSVCLSVREHISGTIRPIFAKFSCILRMSLARSSFVGAAVRCVWMTSFVFVIMTCYVLPSEFGRNK